MQPLAYNYLNYLSNITVIKSPESSTCYILAPVDSPSIAFLLAAQLWKSLNTSEIFFLNSAPVHHTSCKVPFFLKGIVFNWSGTMAWWTLSISEFNRTKLSRIKSVQHELSNFFFNQVKRILQCLTIILTHWLYVCALTLRTMLKLTCTTTNEVDYGRFFGLSQKKFCIIKSGTG